VFVRQRLCIGFSLSKNKFPNQLTFTLGHYLFALFMVNFRDECSSWLLFLYETTNEFWFFVRTDRASRFYHFSCKFLVFKFGSCCKSMARIPRGRSVLLLRFQPPPTIRFNPGMLQSSRSGHGQFNFYLILFYSGHRKAKTDCPRALRVSAFQKGK